MPNMKNLRMFVKVTQYTVAGVAVSSPCWLFSWLTVAGLEGAFDRPQLDRRTKSGWVKASRIPEPFMLIAIPAENDPAEAVSLRRPRRLRNCCLGAEVRIQTGAGLKSGIPDQEYVAAGP